MIATLSSSEISDGLIASLLRAARSVSRKADAALQHLDLTTGQLILLSCLDKVDAPSIGEVASAIVADRTTVTASLKPLLRRRLVAVSVDQADARLRRVCLTKAGRLALAQGTPVILDMELAITTIIPELERFRAELTQVIRINSFENDGGVNLPLLPSQ